MPKKYCAGKPNIKLYIELGGGGWEGEYVAVYVAVLYFIMFYTLGECIHVFMLYDLV